jgi:seryl-tRNA synthetase
MFQYAKPEDSDAAFEELLGKAEKLAVHLWQRPMILKCGFLER